MENQNNQNNQDKQIKFLGEMYAHALIDLLAELDVKDGEDFVSLTLNSDDPESTFYWGRLLSYVYVVASFYEEFNINLLALGTDNKEFAQELLTMCLDLEKAHQNSLEENASQEQDHES